MEDPRPGLLSIGQGVEAESVEIIHIAQAHRFAEGPSIPAGDGSGRLGGGEYSGVKRWQELRWDSVAVLYG